MNARVTHAHACLTGLCLLGLALAWHNRFVQDDAFISFTYAKHLVQGQGLTWFGTHVEGYSNFLWVLWIALGLKVGAEPVSWSYVGGLAAFVTTIYATWRLAGRLLDALVPRVLAVGLLITNYTVSAYATGGLETMLQTGLLCIAVWQFYEVRARPTPVSWRVSAISLTLAAAVLTRMDSLLPSAILGLWGLVYLVRRRAPLRAYRLAVVPFGAVLGAWLVWKHGYYGRALPNSYYIKVVDVAGTYENGLTYLARFFHWYWIWPVLLVGLVALLVRAVAARGTTLKLDLLPILPIVLAWFAYVVRVGGDFMEFRFLVPVAPYVFIAAAYFLWLGFRSRVRAVPVAVSAAAGLLLAGASYRHAQTFTGMTADKTLDSIALLSTFYELYPDGDWGKIGRALKEAVGGQNVVIATPASGAIPYYGDIKTVDMCGLNDLWIPGHGRRAPPEHRRPGHQWAATLSYLKERGVHLVLGHPTLVDRGLVSHPASTRTCQELVHRMLFMNREPIGEATVVAMPVEERSALVMWYLTAHPMVDDLIQRRRWESQRVYVER